MIWNINVCKAFEMPIAQAFRQLFILIFLISSIDDRLRHDLPQSVVRQRRLVLKTTTSGDFSLEELAGDGEAVGDSAGSVDDDDRRADFEAAGGEFDGRSPAFAKDDHVGNWRAIGTYGRC